ncbi:MAG: hypothetical protein IJX63_10160 [Lachnospiraceae bacterium]|nr:hypothetical protein [Lachnospiraceae bacterium]
MSFFKNLLKTVVKEVVENVVENVADSGENRESAKAQATTTRTTEQRVELTTTELVLQDIDGSRECNHTTYDSDGDNECTVEAYYTVAPGFWWFDSGAGEIDMAYSYNPDIKSQEESRGWEVGEPYVAIMHDDISYQMVKQYKSNGTVKAGRTLQKVNHDIMKYKSSYSREDGRYIQYHFWRFDDDIHYHIQAFIPNKYQGTTVEQMVLAALDLMAATYREEHNVKS